MNHWFNKLECNQCWKDSNISSLKIKSLKTESLNH